MSEDLKGFQKKYLRGLAHSLKPVVFIGQKGITPNLFKTFEAALTAHELVKVKFLDYKEKDQKIELMAKIQETIPCAQVGLIGHTAIFFRPHKDPQKRKINIPVRPDSNR